MKDSYELLCWYRRLFSDYDKLDMGAKIGKKISKPCPIPEAEVTVRSYQFRCRTILETKFTGTQEQSDVQDDEKELEHFKEAFQIRWKRLRTYERLPHQYNKIIWDRLQSETIEDVLPDIEKGDTIALHKLLTKLKIVHDDLTHLKGSSYLIRNLNELLRVIREDILTTGASISQKPDSSEKRYS
ncbi:hypothetical protein DINM_000960 [Dirofilaria immitis]|nr:hypothetical protein [Dirofilaria immitis]